VLPISGLQQMGFARCCKPGTLDAQHTAPSARLLRDRELLIPFQPTGSPVLIAPGDTLVDTVGEPISILKPTCLHAMFQAPLGSKKP